MRECPREAGLLPGGQVGLGWSVSSSLGTPQLPGAVAQTTLRFHLCCSFPTGI